VPPPACGTRHRARSPPCSDPARRKGAARVARGTQRAGVCEIAPARACLRVSAPAVPRASGRPVRRHTLSSNYITHYHHVTSHIIIILHHTISYYITHYHQRYLLVLARFRHRDEHVALHLGDLKHPPNTPAPLRERERQRERAHARARESGCVV